MEFANRRRQREPQNLASVSSSRPPVLPVKKSRSYEVAWIRHESFCERGCDLAAQDVMNPEAQPKQDCRADLAIQDRNCVILGRDRAWRNGNAVAGDVARRRRSLRVCSVPSDAATEAGSLHSL